jgi:hypothetical protein
MSSPIPTHEPGAPAAPLPWGPNWDHPFDLESPTENDEVDLDLYAEEAIEYQMQIGDCIYTIFCAACDCTLFCLSSLSCGGTSC